MTWRYAGRMNPPLASILRQVWFTGSCSSWVLEYWASQQFSQAISHSIFWPQAAQWITFRDGTISTQMLLPPFSSSLFELPLFICASFIFCPSHFFLPIALSIPSERDCQQEPQPTATCNLFTFFEVEEAKCSICNLLSQRREGMFLILLVSWTFLEWTR